MAGADYSMNYSEIAKQQQGMTEQLEALNKELANMQQVQEGMLSAADWSAEDKSEFTDRFEAYLQQGNGLYKTGSSQASSLQQIADTYHKAEQR